VPIFVSHVVSIFPQVAPNDNPFTLLPRFLYYVNKKTATFIMDDDADKTDGQSPQGAESLETTSSDGKLDLPGSSISPEVTSPQDSPEDTGSGSVALTPEEQAQHSRQQQTQQSRRYNLRGLWHRVNIYLLAFVFLVIVGIIIAVAAYLKGNQNPLSDNSPQTQNLSSSALQQLANNGTTIGDAKETLNIESNAVFQGAVLVRGNLQVAGTVKMGGTLALQSLTVSGSSSFGQLQAKSISVADNAAIQGQLTAQSLSIAGGGSFNDTVTAPAVITNSLQLNGDLGITHHIDTGGSIPGLSRGGALGSGGTASVSGSDTAGSISIHTGSGASAGCFATISFAHSFGSTPHVDVTPIGYSAGKLDYYVNRSTSSFSVCDASNPPSGASFGFDYTILD